MKIMKNLVLVLMASVSFISFDMQAARVRRFLNNAFHVAKPAVANSLSHWTRKEVQPNRKYPHVPNNYSNWHDNLVIDASGKYTSQATKVEENQNRPLIALSAKSDDASMKIMSRFFAAALGCVSGQVLFGLRTEIPNWWKRYKSMTHPKSEEVFNRLHKEFPDSYIITVGDKMVLTNNLNKEYKTNKISSIIFLVDSRGGNAQATNIYIELYKKYKDRMPVITYVLGNNHSAAYDITSMADKIIVNSEAAVGSIGVVHQNYYLKCGKFKAHGYTDCTVALKQDREYLEVPESTENSYKKAAIFFDDSDLREAATKIVMYYDLFLENVKKNRANAGRLLPQDTTLWAEGRIFGNWPGKLNPESDTLEKALEYGLIDRILAPDQDYVAVICEELTKLHEARAKKLAAAEQTIA